MPKRGGAGRRFALGRPKERENRDDGLNSIVLVVYVLGEKSIFDKRQRLKWLSLNSRPRKEHSTFDSGDFWRLLVTLRDLC